MHGQGNVDNVFSVNVKHQFSGFVLDFFGKYQGWEGSNLREDGVGKFCQLFLIQSCFALDSCFVLFNLLENEIRWSKIKKLQELTITSFAAYEHANQDISVKVIAINCNKILGLLGRLILSFFKIDLEFGFFSFPCFFSGLFPCGFIA